jgi:hypothetical protein
MRKILSCLPFMLALLAPLGPGTVMAGGATTAGGQARFPLRVSAEGRYLEDAGGTPFLMTGDTSWSLIADLTLEEASFYLADRKARGFNTILVSLIEHEFSRNAPNNADGTAPFLVPGDFARPNDPYFAAAEKVLEAASEAGMLVLLAPAYIGANGGSQGWYAEMAAAGPEALRIYGRYVAKRFARFTNIIWVQGGDYDPPDRALIHALAQGIEEGAPGAVQTVHGNRDTVTDRYWPDARWLALDTVYTYEDTAAAVLARYRSGPRRPFFMIESRYEFEHGVEAPEIRKIAYGALLSGASGQIYGNNPVWHFGGPKLYDAPMGWKEALGSKGAESMTHLSRLFQGLDWWKLRPDEGRLVPGVEGQTSASAIAATAGDGSFAALYVYDATSIDLDPGALADPTGTIEWYDPSTGAMVASGRYDGGGKSPSLTLPGSSNSAGATDWFAVLRAGD